MSDEKHSETKRPTFSVGDDFKCHRTKTYNVLLVGESRTGKTTFIRTLADLQYTVQREVYRGTEFPQTTSLLVELDDGEHISINLIDTPGFGEVSLSGGRSDRTLQTMVSEFVKRDVTSLNMVLLCTEGNSGLTRSKVEALTGVMHFLGRSFAPVTHMLVTHFEEADRQAEDLWLEKFQENSHTRFLQYVCQGGYLFTGALTQAAYLDVARRDQFALQQKKRQLEFFNALLSGPTIPLMADSGRNQLSVHQSIISKYLICKELEKEVVANKNAVTKMKSYLNERMDTKSIQSNLQDRVTKALAACDDAGAEGKAVFSQGDIDECIVEYQNIAESIKNLHTDLLHQTEQYNKWDASINQIYNIVRFELGPMEFWPTNTDA